MKLYVNNKYIGEYGVEDGDTFSANIWLSWATKIYSVLKQVLLFVLHSTGLGLLVLARNID